MTKEIKSLTGLRGISALWVVIFHYYSNPKIPVFQTIIKQGYVAVDIFFILSAFLLTIAYKNRFADNISYEHITTFYKKRINRIFPAYLVSLLAMILIIYFIRDETVSLKQLLINVTLTQCFFDLDGIIINIVYWSLSTEWICYLVFPILLLFIGNMKYKTLTIIILLGGILRVLLPFLPDLMIGGTTFSYNPGNGDVADISVGINSLIRTISCYLIGIGLALLPLAQNRNSDMNIYTFTILSVVSLFIPNGVFVTPIFVGLLIMHLYNNEEDNFIGQFLKWRPIYFLGEISYSLYLFHMVISSLNINLFDDKLSNRIIWLILSFIISVFTYYLVEKKIKIFKI